MRRTSPSSRQSRRKSRLCQRRALAPPFWRPLLSVRRQSRARRQRFHFMSFLASFGTFLPKRGLPLANSAQATSLFHDETPRCTSEIRGKKVTLPLAELPCMLWSLFV